MSSVRTVHLPPTGILTGIHTGIPTEPKPPRTERHYRRPDICLLRSIIASVNQMRKEVRDIGEEESYAVALRVLRTQAQMVADLSCELLQRFEADGTVQE